MEPPALYHRVVILLLLILLRNAVLVCVVFFTGFLDDVAHAQDFIIKEVVVLDLAADIEELLGDLQEVEDVFGGTDFGVVKDLLEELVDFDHAGRDDHGVGLDPLFLG